MTTTALRRPRLLLVRQYAARLTQHAIDLAVLAAAFYLAYQLRFEFQVPPGEALDLAAQWPWVVILQMGALRMVGAQAFMWRYIGMSEVRPFITAAVASVAPLLVFRFVLPDSWAMFRVPVSVILIDALIAFVGLLAVRVGRRALYERTTLRPKAAPSSGTRPTTVLLIGAGRTGILAAREIQSNPSLGVEIAGFIDDDRRKHGSTIQNLRVLGGVADLPRLVPPRQIDHVVITMEELSRHELKRIREICAAIPVKVRIVPAMSELLQGRLSFSRIRDVQTEDLLGRAPVQLDPSDMARLLGQRVVMVTGAGGSIGSELARQVTKFAPAELLLVERSEFALFNIERELKTALPDMAIRAVLADIGNEARLREVFARYQPSVVLHAAAHKHVPMIEHNPTEAITNNVIATHTLGKVAGESGVEVFVLISTDKAVRPTSVMGASKRITELVIQSLNRAYRTRYVAVRFGNVIGSAGSVVPLFREQIRRGGPVVVTDPDMVRYFMTIPEAAQLVLQAAAMGEGGEIFVLDMGEPVKILDLAKETIRLSGFRPFLDIDIVFSGLRPGEKLFEELELTGEDITKTRHPKIFIGRVTSYSDEHIAQILERLAYLSRRSGAEVRAYLNRVLPEARLAAPDGEAAHEEAPPTAPVDGKPAVEWA